MRTQGSALPRLLPSPPAWMRLAIAGTFVAALAYVMVRLDEPTAPAPGEPPLEVVVAVPQLDQALLDQVADESRAERLVLQAEPLRHLLARAIDVVPTVAAALGIPEQPVPVAEVRADVDAMRGRWLWYEGRLEQLSGPLPGHPIQGYSIYEALVDVGAAHVVAAFSLPPAANIQVGSWVRVEGYLLQLRDLTYPSAIEQAPMLVGRTIQPDFPDWPAVTELEPQRLAGVDDSSYWPHDKPFHTLEEDQTEALWHLGAFVRDTASTRSLADWRKVPTLSAAEPYERLVDGKFARGEPLRVFGMLVRRRTIAAPSNPANIRFWTEAWVQAREFGGHLVPVWVPQRVRDLPNRAQLEVRGFYYRWYAYETEDGKRIRVPLFVAADLDEFDLETDATMRTIGAWIGGVAFVLLSALFIGQRRAARASVEHARKMDERRRRRRQRSARPGAEVPGTS